MSHSGNYGSLNESRQIIQVEELSLDGWLNLLLESPDDVLYKDWEFPTKYHFEEYTKSIAVRSDEDLKMLLRRFLIPSGTLGIDEYQIEALKQEPDRLLSAHGYFRRLLFWHSSGEKTPPPWEGITWILDLLPYWPGEALRALNAYILAHIQILPDGRINGLGEAAELIRAKFVGTPKTNRQAAVQLSREPPRVLECLVERLYDSMGYDTQLTRLSKDGGRDVLASRFDPSRAEKVLIQCKRYAKNVGVSHVRELLGVVASEKANKGVLATTSFFTNPAKEWASQNPLIELISGTDLVALLNEFLGARWNKQIERLVIESERGHM